MSYRLYFHHIFVVVVQSRGLQPFSLHELQFIKSKWMQAFYIMFVDKNSTQLHIMFRFCTLDFLVHE